MNAGPAVEDDGPDAAAICRFRASPPGATSDPGSPACPTDSSKRKTSWCAGAAARNRPVRNVKRTEFDMSKALVVFGSTAGAVKQQADLKADSGRSGDEEKKPVRVKRG